MSPRASFGGQYLHEDLFSMAAAYAFHIAENQPFLDGNKRAALSSAAVFLELNGFSLRDERLYDAMIALSSRALDKRGLADLFRQEASPLTPP